MWEEHEILVAGNWFGEQGMDSGIDGLARDRGRLHIAGVVGCLWLREDLFGRGRVAVAAGAAVTVAAGL